MIVLVLFLCVNSCMLGDVRQQANLLAWKFNIQIEAACTQMDIAGASQRDSMAKIERVLNELSRTMHGPLIRKWVELAYLRRILFVDGADDGSGVAVTQENGGLTCRINVGPNSLEGRGTQWISEVDRGVSSLLDVRSREVAHTRLVASLERAGAPQFYLDEIRRTYRFASIAGIVTIEKNAERFRKLLVSRHSKDVVISYEVTTSVSAWRAPQPLASGTLQGNEEYEATIAESQDRGDWDLVLSRRHYGKDSGEVGVRETTARSRSFSLIVGDAFPSLVGSDGYNFDFPKDNAKVEAVIRLLTDHFERKWIPMMDSVKVKTFVLCDNLRFRYTRVPVALSPDGAIAFVDVADAITENMFFDRASFFDYNMRYLQAASMADTIVSRFDPVTPWREILPSQSRELHPNWHWNENVHDVAALYASLSTTRESARVTLKMLVRKDAVGSPLKANLNHFLRTMRTVNAVEYSRMQHLWKSHVGAPLRKPAKSRQVDQTAGGQKGAPLRRVIRYRILRYALATRCVVLSRQFIRVRT